MGNCKLFQSPAGLSSCCMPAARLGIALLIKSGLAAAMGVRGDPPAIKKFGLACTKRLANHSWHPGLQGTRGMVHVWDTDL